MIDASMGLSMRSERFKCGEALVSKNDGKVIMSAHGELGKNLAQAASLGAREHAAQIAPCFAAPGALSEIELPSSYDSCTQLRSSALICFYGIFLKKRESVGELLASLPMICESLDALWLGERSPGLVIERNLESSVNERDGAHALRCLAGKILRPAVRAPRARRFSHDRAAILMEQLSSRNAGALIEGSEAEIARRKNEMANEKLLARKGRIKAKELSRSAWASRMQSTILISFQRSCMQKMSLRPLRKSDWRWRRAIML